ncbi:c-type cytochrome [Adhaeribacter pallidiroseus]|uniref:Nitrite reductase (NO-forming) n=1 Tax=Adhaeribacter pallidiroseus TaxID=2072847 RepID=A0A369QJX1_9BACT|nr:cytochrome c [Adhaeribacter pallidiroseus]RDC63935.1 Nitrite reductase (NO-forming) [Adhaeribacter pallidiroseus]
MLKNKNSLLLLIPLVVFSWLRCSPAVNDSGEQLYVQHCASCHMEDGRGLKRLIPPLANADYLVKHRQDLACIMKHGQEGNITVNGLHYQQKMPGAEDLTPDQITNLLNFVQTNFGNNNERFTIPEVSALLDACAAHNH